jgi:UDP-N-acetylmuramate dehydrogenase
MNAGGHGSDMAATLLEVQAVDLATASSRRVPAGDLELAYRSSTITAPVVVTSATLALVAGDRDEGRATLADIVRWRRANQPGGRNAGSVFKNPPGTSAGALIDQAGLRGRRLGTAWVSERHANFIQVDEGGRAGDVLALVELVRGVVAERTGTRLETELRVLGDFGVEP